MVFGDAVTTRIRKPSIFDQAIDRRRVIVAAIKAVVSVGCLLAVLAFLIAKYDLSSIRTDFEALRLTDLAIALLALLANALMASIRFKTVVRDVGHRISFRDAAHTVSASSLAGLLFFQLAGQLIARGSIMRRGGIPFSNVIVVTLYERVIAAIVSASIALGGAYFLFGQIYIDPNTGGNVLIKLVVGLLSAGTAGVLIAFGKKGWKKLSRLPRYFGASLLRVIVMTVLVQLPVMLAYVSLAHVLSPAASIANLIAASAIVMFVASVPISFAGWGVREMSAVAALGFVGVSAHAAFATAVFIGLGGLIVTAMVCVASASELRASPAMSDIRAQDKVNYERALVWALPLAVATFVPFQIYIPIGTGLLNVNLADPIAVITSSLFVVSTLKKREAPVWRVAYINQFVVLATVLLTYSLFVGIGAFGLTDWAWVNRYLGWFVLLSYGATGALIVKDGGEDGLKSLALTYVGAMIAISGLDLCLLAFTKVDLTHSTTDAVVTASAINGFSQNHNFFAFQLLIAASAVMVFAETNKLRTALLSITFAALWFSGSRSGWMSLIGVLAAALYIGAIRTRDLTCSLGVASVIAGCITAIAFLHSTVPQTITPLIVPASASTSERMLTWIEGYKLFAEHPLFGAGLGSFRNLHLLAASGTPLLIHSTGLWLLAELGVVGFLGFVIPFALLFFKEFKTARKERASTLIVLCIITFAMMSIPADMLYQRTFWLLIGAAVALVHGKPNKPVVLDYAIGSR